MANGQQKAEQNHTAFQLWVASQTDDDFKQIVFRGQLNRKEIVKAAGFSRSALNQNPRIKESLEKLEFELRERGVLPRSSETETKNTETAYDQSERKNQKNANRLSSLEQENIALKAENARLKKQLLRYLEVGEIMDDLGRFPI